MTSKIAMRSLRVDDTSVTITWGDDESSVFHLLWLRDNCACDGCGPHDSGSRVQRLLDIPADIRPAHALIEGPTLRIDWAAPHEHTSTFDGSWLRAHAYSSDRVRQEHRPAKTLWDSSLPRWPAVQWDQVLQGGDERYRLFAAVAEFGFVVVRGAGTVRDTIEDLAAEMGYVRETHYGRTFDLITRAKPLILADLAGPMLPHTDESYRRVPTGINIFHCIEPSGDGGGASQLVDAHLIAALLKEHHPDAYGLLTSVPIRHERRVEGQTIVAELPAIIVDHDDEVIEVRLNERTMTALNVPPSLMLPTYRALRTAFAFAYDPAHRIEYSLEAGEALIFDNLRVLHGRTGYGGARFLQQTQVMRDEFYAMHAALAERHELGASTSAGAAL